MSGQDTIGTAKIDVVVDTSQFDVAIDRAKNRTASMTNAAQQEYAKLDRAEKRRVDRLIDTQNKIGLTAEAQQVYNIAMKTTGALQEELLGRFKRLNGEQDRAVVSAKANAAAMRQLPMQFTDIFVGLASGQKPMMVLLQQGGQLKDTLGGVGNALKASASYVASLVNPLTLSAGAAAALGIAFYKGRQESVEFGKALAITGNIAGVTRDQLIDMSDTMDHGTTTQRKAAEALAAVARSGEIGGASFRTVAEAAIAMERMTGQAIDKTVAEFAKLGSDPANALAKLNEQHHFLTASVYEQVRALEEQGRVQEAARLATETYAGSVIQRAKDMEGQLGYLEKAWKALKLGADGAWDAMLGVGRDDSNAKKFRDLHAQLLEIENPSDFASYAHLGAKGSEQRRQAAAEIRRQMTEIQDENVRAAKEANQKRIAQEANDAAIAQALELIQYRSMQEKKTAEIKRINEQARVAIFQAEQIGDKALVAKLATNRDALLKGVEKKYIEKEPAAKKKELTDEEKAAKLLAQAYESVNSQLDRQIALFGNTTNAARIAYEIQSGNLKGLAGDLKGVLAEQAKWLDWQQEMVDIEKAWADSAAEYNKNRAKDSADTLTEFANQAARNIQDVLGDTLYNVLDGKFGDIGDSFASMLKHMAAELASSQLLQLLTTTLSGVQGEGGLATFARSIGAALTTGGKAEGGYTGPGGKFEPAGVVHKGEVVWSQRDIARAGGVATVEAMRLGLRGYANGGWTGESGPEVVVARTMPPLIISPPKVVACRL